MYICIYCGYGSKELIDFRYILKDGTYSRKMFKCPLCENTMKKETLKMNMNARQWARYLYYCIRFYKKDNYYEKINWEGLSKNIKIYGIANEFWESWREVKEESKDKDFEYFLDGIIEIKDNIEKEEIQQRKLF